MVKVIYAHRIIKYLTSCYKVSVLESRGRGISSKIGSAVCIFTGETGRGGDRRGGGTRSALSQNVWGVWKPFCHSPGGKQILGIGCCSVLLQSVDKESVCYIKRLEKCIWIASSASRREAAGNTYHVNQLSSRNMYPLPIDVHLLGMLKYRVLNRLMSWMQPYITLHGYFLLFADTMNFYMNVCAVCLPYDCEGIRM